MPPPEAQPQIRERPAGKAEPFRTEGGKPLFSMDRSGMNNILVTAAPGSIGSHLVDHLLTTGEWRVTVVDDFNDFYDPAIKSENVSSHLDNANYRLFRIDIGISRRWNKFLQKLIFSRLSIWRRARACGRPCNNHCFMPKRM